MMKMFPVLVNQTKTITKVACCH